MEYLNNFEEISSRFDAFIFDIYGVLHNGVRAIPESIHFLKSLQTQGKSVYVLSNAPFLRHHVVQRLSALGIPPSLYQHILTAGEDGQRHLIEKNTPQHARLGDKCYFLGLSEMESILQNTGIQKCSSLEDADFFLAAGPNEWGQRLEDYQELLDASLAQGLPMLCANPDHFVFKGSVKRLRAGYLAHYYEAHGGEVLYHGKPYKKFYKPILDEIPHIPHDRILCIGDSFHTDMKGASESQISSLLVLSLLTYDELGYDVNLLPQTEQLIQGIPVQKIDFNKEEQKKLFTKIEKQVYTPQYVIQLST